MKAQVTFTSDWHVGSGTGIPGSIDRLVLRDQDGLPYIPAKTLTGMLRDGCELVAECLGGAWLDVLDALFGTEAHEGQGRRLQARSAKLSIRRAQLPEPLRRALLREPALRDALTFVAPHVAIDGCTGRADDGKLFFVEMVRASTLCAKVVSHGRLTDSERALLSAGSRAVRQLGGKRRRGLGRCALRLDEDELAHRDWAELLARPPERPEHASAQPSIAAFEPAAPNATGQVRWTRLALQVRAISPLCIPRRTVGNQVESLDFVPGTLLLPLVHAALQDVKRNPACMVRAGHLVVTHAYPAQPDGSPSWPVPQALCTPKGGHGLKDGRSRVVNLLVEPPGREQLRPCRSGYVTADTPSKKRPSYRSVELTLSMHATVEDRRQRPTEEVGGVYAYQAIPAGTLLCAEVRVGGATELTQSEVQEIREALEKRGHTYAVGRSKKDDFGQVRISVTDPPADAREGPNLSQHTVNVWLLSDVLVRDRLLGWSTRPEDVVRELGRQLKAPLQLDDGRRAALGRGRRLEGWIRAWDRPRPTLSGLVAGSCLFVRTSEPLTAAAVQAVHLAGIGERRAEGFGQVRIAPALLASGVPEQDPTAAPDPLDHTAHHHEGEVIDDLTTLLERTHWESCIRRRAAAFSRQARPLGVGARSPTSSQLGALRERFSRLRDAQTGRQELVVWLIRRMATGDRGRGLDRASRALFALLEWPCPEAPAFRAWERWLQGHQDDAVCPPGWQRAPGSGALLKPPPQAHAREVWKHLFAGADGALAWPAVLAQSRREALADELWPFAVRALVEAVCATALDERERSDGREEPGYGA